MSEQGSPSRVVPAGLVIAILLVTANLRPTLTGVGPLLPFIEKATGVTAVAGGVLNTLPLLAFALTSPFVGRISHRCGAGRTIVAMLVVLTCGTVLRSLPPVPFLFIGTVLLSAAIAFGNVLIPSIIREYVPDERVHAFSSWYVTVMAAVAAVSSGISVPLAGVLPGGWRSAIGWGIVFVPVALVVWVIQFRGRLAAPSLAAAHSPAPWRSWLAWQVSFFMGLQSLVFFTVLAWLPSILVEGGMNPAQAGWMLFLYQAVELVVGLLMPVVIRGRITDARVAVGASALVAAGFLLLVVTPGLVVVSCVVLGVGSGAVLVLAFSFQSKRANGQAQAAALAGMAQSIGYLIAAAGPLILGVLHAATANWTASLFVLGVASVAMGFFGYASGQQKHLRAERTPITRYKTDDHAN